jgi:hypothetical protein
MVVALAAMSLAAGAAVIALSQGGAGVTGLIPDAATLGVLLNRDVGQWWSLGGR